MSGTKIDNLKLTKVVDGDTIKVEIDGKEESLRLACLDTEESRAGTKPKTKVGVLASKWAKEYFGADEQGIPVGEVHVDIEFDTSDPVPVVLERHRGNYGRLICYVHKDDENYNLKAIQQGWSPYFVKYGRSRLYHKVFLQAEAAAQAGNLAIWDPETNAGGNRRDYTMLLPWWHMRGSVVQDYRHSGIQSGAKSVRLDYADIVAAAQARSPLTVFCDLQGGVGNTPGNGAVIYAGSRAQRFNLWIPDRDTDTAGTILQLVTTRYTGHGRGYLYVSGEASEFRGTPQIVLTDVGQLSDLPPGQ